QEAFAAGDVAVLESDEVPSPVTLGSRRPVILLPPGFFASASADEVATALGHEMAHVRRRDYARSILSLAAGAAGLPRPSIPLSVADTPFLEVRMKSILYPLAPASPRRTRANLAAAF